MTRVLAVTTFNRLSRLNVLLNSFESTHNGAYSWLVVIADDGSTDGTIEYIESLQLSNIDIVLLRNNRQGIHHQTNTIIRYLEGIDFEVCYKCDDDIFFKKEGWDDLYYTAMCNSGYDHLCYYNTAWRPHEVNPRPVINKSLVSFSKAIHVQGAFYTITPRVIKKVGYMDTQIFGFRGIGHIDYTMRACRAGFNHPDHPFDVLNSDSFIGMNLEAYSSSMPSFIWQLFENESETKRKIACVKDMTRLYIPYKEGESLFSTDLNSLLIDHSEEQKERINWYEKHYGHQPEWFVRLGKVLFNPGIFSEKLKRIYEISVKRIFKKL